MKIMWVVAQITPDMATILSYPKSAFGGWVQNMLDELRTCAELEISVVGCASINKSRHRVLNNIEYYILPIAGKNKSVSEEEAKQVVDSVKPDVIHIEGTEFGISNCFSKFRCCPNIISLQGILSGYEKYQFGGLPLEEMMFSVKYAWAGWTLFFRKILLFNNRIAVENETIRNADYLLGRTIWDRAHSYKINTSAPYFECPRILRQDFYGKEWSEANCRPHSVFVGNGYSALKGGHFVIEAIDQLRNEFPDIHLYFAGQAPFDKKLGMKSSMGYAAYVKKLIRGKGLSDYVTYLGVLPGDKMAEMMLSSNVYVLPSLIENSPNTLGEAMILGVPVVSAYTGGVPSMVEDSTEALLYRADDPVMLAWQIKQVFDNPEAATERAKNAKEHAMKTHDAGRNRKIMLDIYHDIVDGGDHT
ncbi:MAG: glycosyltransferase family 4 protein [Bacteroidales bacterium]|nr:glycosyltransferase family 4 protein [Bacteroidales bacterium]